mmetsp:Transcript_20142/g.41756  ORF Transcript_20142/g.41756 Transcript_20142/m.41756 type:complete len:290 (+) Transcript_20142:1096-1965(+)
MPGQLDVHAADRVGGKTVQDGRGSLLHHRQREQNGRSERHRLEKEFSRVLDRSDFDQARDCRQGRSGQASRLCATVFEAHRTRGTRGEECRPADGVFCCSSHAAARGRCHEGSDHSYAVRGGYLPTETKDRSRAFQPHRGRCIAAPKSGSVYLCNLSREPPLEFRHYLLYAGSCRNPAGRGRHPVAVAPDRDYHVLSPAFLRGCRGRKLCRTSRENLVPKAGHQNRNRTGTARRMEEIFAPRDGGFVASGGNHELAQVRRVCTTNPSKRKVPIGARCYRGGTLKGWIKP